ncbi:MAG: LuxR C-terminal-related transcriptional regulator, partial [Micromonosporaceae bacterium]
LALLEKSLTAAIQAGDHARALGLVRAALAEVDASAEPLRAARLLERRAKLLRTFGKSDGAAELRQAYDLAGRVDDATQRATLLADLAAALASADREGGARIAQEAAAVARDLGDAAVGVSAAITFGRVCSRALSVEAGLVEMQRAAEQARAAGDLAGRVRALVNMSDLLFELGRYAESAQSAEDGWPDAQRLGLGRTSGVFLLTNHAEALLALGQWDAAEAQLAEAYRLDPPGTLGLPYLVLRSRLRLARGHPSAAELATRTVGFLSAGYLALQPRLAVQELRISAALAAGDTAGALTAARAALAGVAPDASALAVEPRYAWPLLTAAARAAAAGSDEELQVRVRTLAGQIPARYPAEQANAAEVTALLGAGATPEQACAAWQTAVLAWRLDGQPYPLARVLLAHAESAAAAGEKSLAADLLTEAGAIASQLAAAPIVDAVATLARRLGVRGQAGGAAAGTGEVLTGRELEVLRLVADGLSNRRIAERLFISPKTASVHVSRIIAKLEASNRMEAAALARRLGLLDSA